MTDPFWVIEPADRRPRLVHVNATATGGGVAELLSGLVPAQRARGANAAWAVTGGNAEFFAVTKYLYRLLHGQVPAAPLDDPEYLTVYRAVLAEQAPWFLAEIGPGDVAVLHDTQTIGLAPALRAAGARVVWHCHVGAEIPPERGPGAVWRALAGELAAVDAVVTTLPQFAPPGIPDERRFVAAPAIDPDAPKNRELAPGEGAALLAEAGLTADRTSPRATVVQDAPLPPDARVVVQVSRWDPLKDMVGVVRCFTGLPPDVHLVLAGTDPSEVSDDPEGRAVLAEVTRVRAELPPAERARVHLVSLSMRPPEWSALVVNALQRRADVVVQKSLEEGFGLTVTEAMVKGRAVVASAVGGIRLQIADGENGVLVDPADTAGVRRALARLLDDPALRRRLGERARRSATARYTMRRLADDYARVAAPDAAPAS
ncbi:glycosyltransferase [Actinomadura rayongensis]|uniref:Glycosyltransferase n=1 Tax=Actinomadura rayongensis TaxID=1429076 RepID=A0A6I4WMX3_9ACTN|nr:glycosyltransferase [Actinomadura rayongensis]MXQ68294.1 glycosyltransferase [Actinomadura rayongensis]